MKPISLITHLPVSWLGAVDYEEIEVEVSGTYRLGFGGDAEIEDFAVCDTEAGEYITQVLLASQIRDFKNLLLLLAEKEMQEAAGAALDQAFERRRDDRLERA
jgi:hypothetical protein